MSIPAHAWFVVSEIMILPNWPAAMPKEGLYFNIVLWTTFIILSYLGWKESGAALPDTRTRSFPRDGSAPPSSCVRSTIPSRMGCPSSSSATR